MKTPTKHNFGAGPCILPPSVLDAAAAAVKSWENTGLSVLEISHRSPEFDNVISETQLLVRQLLNVPTDYSILFLQGGASMQFCMVPMNFLSHQNKHAVYLDAGYFGRKALKEAELFGRVEVIAAENDGSGTAIPLNYTVPPDAAYFHCTSNNTIEGTEMFNFPETSVPLICDMSSDIFSRVIDVSKFDLIYAGAQKNMGPAGMTLVIVKNSLLQTVKHKVPSMLDYRIYRDNQSMYNTPPVFSIYAAMLNLRWLQQKGGIEQIALNNEEKARLLYNEIDRNSLFYGTAAAAHRSLMNITFRMYDITKEAEFLAYAARHGMVGIKGYRTVGGFRASLYNALPLESVRALIECMKSYEITPQISFVNNFTE